MLAMANQRGIVEASIPGLAVLARVTLEECEEAIKILEAPDPYSRSTEHEGRRIQKVDGGWLILNHAKYRAKLNADERREYNRVKQKESRVKKLSANVSNVNDASALSAHTDTDTDTEAKEVSQNLSAAKPAAVELGSPNFHEFWKIYPKKLDKQEALHAWVKGLCDGHIREILTGVEAWKKCAQWQDSEGIPYPSTWLSKRRWKETPQPTISKAEQKARNTDAAADRIRQRMHSPLVNEVK